MNPKMILYAPRIHVGGGLVLLKALVDELGDRVAVILDQRCPLSPPPETVSVRVKAGIRSYFQGEHALCRLTQRYPDLPILCFSSLPPSRRYPSPTMIYLQNRYVVVDGDEAQFSARVRVRLWIERMWFRRYRRNVDRVLVQSSSMAALVKRKFPELDVEVVPFAEHPDVSVRKEVGSEQKVDFLFVSAPYPHKNHARLLEAWGLLAKDGYFPSLGLVFSEEQGRGLEAAVAKINASQGTKIFKWPEVTPAERFSLYSRAKALIFPSYFETYGLPLIEAASAGLPILAPELDYVRDSVAPRETFDPYSAVSIARAVRRFMGSAEAPKLPLSTEEFIAYISGSRS